MAQLTRFRIGLLAALGLIVVTAIYLISGPALLNESTIRALVTQNLRDWTGAGVSVNGSTRLSYFPRPEIEIRRVHLAGIKRLPLVTEMEAKRVEVEFGLWSLITGAPVIHRVTLIEPQIKSRAEPRSSDTEAPAFVHALATAPFDQIRLKNGKVTVIGPKTTEEFTNITAKIDLRGSDGAHSSRGTFTWRKQPISFNYSADKLLQVANTATMPITVTLDGDLFSAEIEGNAIITDGLRVTGNLDLEIPNLPSFAKWTGILVPDDQTQGDFTANGTFHWSGHRIGFDESTFALDGNRALGAMALEFGGPRPQIEGTLALQKLDLTRYFQTGDAPAPGSKTAKKNGKSQKTVDVDFPILHHINIDLRISTTELTAAPLKLGQSAISFSLKSGKLMADLAIFDICGGNANGRLEFDATVPDSAIRVTGNLRGISTKTCIEIFTSDSALEGVADLSADVTGKGRTASEIFKSLKGKVSLSISDGQADIDIPKLVASLRKGPVHGWDDTRGSATSFLSLDGAFFLRRGEAYTDSLKIDLGKTGLEVEGTINMKSQALDMRLMLMERATQATAPPKTPPDDNKQQDKIAVAIVIKGPWSNPTFNLEPPKSSAENTSLGAETRTVLRGRF